MKRRFYGAAPSKRVRVVVWNRVPDGRHMIYFAMGGVEWAIGETGGTWTAISRLPSLEATVLWGQGDTFAGGGMFTSNESFWLAADKNTFLIRDNSGLRREAAPRDYHLSRMKHDGWMPRGDGSIFEKTIQHGWILRRLHWSGGYELEQPGESKLSFPDWQWADWDRHRLAWTDGGCLRAAELGTHRLGPVRTLIDFNATAPALGEK